MYYFLIQLITRCNFQKSVLKLTKGASRVRISHKPYMYLVEIISEQVADNESGMPSSVGKITLNPFNP